MLLNGCFPALQTANTPASRKSPVITPVEIEDEVYSKLSLGLVNQQMSILTSVKPINDSYFYTEQKFSYYDNHIRIRSHANPTKDIINKHAVSFEAINSKYHLMITAEGTLYKHEVIDLTKPESAVFTYYSKPSEKISSLFPVPHLSDEWITIYNTLENTSDTTHQNYKIDLSTRTKTEITSIPAAINYEQEFIPQWNEYIIISSNSYININSPVNSIFIVDANFNRLQTISDQDDVGLPRLYDYLKMNDEVVGNEELSNAFAYNDYFIYIKENASNSMHLDSYVATRDLSVNSFLMTTPFTPDYLNFRDDYFIYQDETDSSYHKYTVHSQTSTPYLPAHVRMAYHFENDGETLKGVFYKTSPRDKSLYYFDIAMQSSSLVTDKLYQAYHYDNTYYLLYNYFGESKYYFATLDHDNKIFVKHREFPKATMNSMEGKNLYFTKIKEAKILIDHWNGTNGVFMYDIETGDVVDTELPRVIATTSYYGDGTTYKNLKDHSYIAATNTIKYENSYFELDSMQAISSKEYLLKQMVADHKDGVYSNTNNKYIRMSKEDPLVAVQYDPVSDTEIPIFTYESSLSYSSQYFPSYNSQWLMVALDSENLFSFNLETKTKGNSFDITNKSITKVTAHQRASDQLNFFLFYFTDVNSTQYLYVYYPATDEWVELANHSGSITYHVLGSGSKIFYQKRIQPGGTIMLYDHASKTSSSFYTRSTGQYWNMFPLPEDSDKMIYSSRDLSEIVLIDIDAETSRLYSGYSFTINGYRNFGENHLFVGGGSGYSYHKINWTDGTATDIASVNTGPFNYNYICYNETHDKVLYYSRGVGSPFPHTVYMSINNSEGTAAVELPANEAVHHCPKQGDYFYLKTKASPYTIKQYRFSDLASTSLHNQEDLGIPYSYGIIDDYASNLQYILTNYSFTKKQDGTPQIYDWLNGTLTNIADLFGVPDAVFTQNQISSDKTYAVFFGKPSDSEKYTILAYNLKTGNAFPVIFSEKPGNIASFKLFPNANKIALVSSIGERKGYDIFIVDLQEAENRYSNK